MSQPYQALYRSWRPQRFDGVVGQEHVIRTLANALRTGRVAHAYLFAGPRGTGKTSVAKLLAKAVNCLSPEGVEPCNRCEVCREINDGSTMDVLEIDAASNRGIDEIRELRERVRYAPARARYKVYIIDEVHMLTTEAFNALLKTLEEPPAHALFILATTEPHRLPATIVSRCQRFDFHRLTPEQILERLQAVCTAMGVEAEPAALRLLARLAEGGLRDALSLLDQSLAMAGDRLDAQVVADLLGLAPGEGILALTRAVVDGDVGAGLQAVAELSAQGVDLAQALRDWVACWRDLLALRAGLDERHLLYAGPELAGDLAPLARALDDETALACFDALAEGESLLRWSGQPRLALEAALIRAVGERVARQDRAAAGREAAPGGPKGTGAGRAGDDGTRPVAAAARRGAAPAAVGPAAAPAPGAGVPGGEPVPEPVLGPVPPPPAGVEDGEPLGTGGSPRREAAGDAGALTEDDAAGHVAGGTAAGSAAAPRNPAPAAAFAAPGTGAGDDPGTGAGTGTGPAVRPGAGTGGAAALAEQWDGFLKALRRRREWTALHALLRAAGRPRAAGEHLEIPFAQPGMARTAEVKLPQLRQAIQVFLGSAVPVRVVVEGMPPDSGGDGSGRGTAGTGARRPAGRDAADRPASPGPRGTGEGVAPAGEEAPVAAATGRPAAARDPGDPPGAVTRVSVAVPPEPPEPAGRDGAQAAGSRPASGPGAGTGPTVAGGGPATMAATPGGGGGRAVAGAGTPEPRAPVPAASQEPSPPASVPEALGSGAPGAAADLPSEAAPGDLDDVQKAAWELFGGQWIPVKEEWRRELRPHGQDAETA